MYKNELHLSNYGFETCINTNIQIQNNSLMVVLSLKACGETEVEELFSITFSRNKILSIKTNSFQTHTYKPSSEQIQEELSINITKSKFFESVVKIQSQSLEDIWEIIDNQDNPEEVLFNKLFS